MGERQEHAEGMREQEQRIRESDSTMGGIAEEMERDMREKSPGEAIKDDMKAVKQDLKDTFSRGDSDEGSDEDREA